MKEEKIVPYRLPEAENHSFLFTHRTIQPELEAPLHQHDAWELYYVLQGSGQRAVGDHIQPFTAGDVVFIPPQIPHNWKFDPRSADDAGNIAYLMLAFSPTFLENIIQVFPEIKRAFANVDLPKEARQFYGATAKNIRRSMEIIDAVSDFEQLIEVLRLLPMVFTATDYTHVGRANTQTKQLQRTMDIVAYVMTHYQRHISLDEIAQHVGMNRSSFCIYFKQQKGITFSQFLTKYRLDTACELLCNSQRQITDIAYSVGFKSLSHFVHTFTKAIGISPSIYRRAYQDNHHISIVER